jgi:hypothetical protein
LGLLGIATTDMGARPRRVSKRLCRLLWLPC